MARPKSPIGKRGYARILRRLVDQPSTVQQVMDACVIGRTAAYRILPSMCVLGLAHVSGWLSVKDKPYQPIYSAGDGAEAPMPDARPNGRPVAHPKPAPRRQPPAELIAFADVVRALDAPHSAIELAEATGQNITSIRRLLDHMRGLGLVRIASWERRLVVGGPPIPSYEFAIDGQDAPRLKRIPKTQRNAQYRITRAARRHQMRFMHAVTGLAA
jgi:hypothetical protein